MADSEPKKLPTAPESLLKKRKNRQTEKAKRAQARLLAKKENAKKRRVIFKRAEEYIREYKKRERDNIRLHRQARKHGNFFVEDEPRLAFVIRIRG
ncbi:large ribosomal subunit protein uL30-like, partial [Diadema antillarum]